MHRRARLGRRALPRRSRSRRGSSALFDAVGFTLPNTRACCSRRGRSSSRSSSASSSRSLASLRPAMRATRVPPIAAVREGATLPAGPLRPLPRVRLGRRSRSLGFALARLRACSGAACRRPQILVFMGLGVVLDLHRRRALLVAARRPLAAVIGWPGAELGGAAGRARARERAAQPAADRLDRGRADDRARARHARRDARLGDPQLVLRRRRQDLHSRLRGHGPEQLRPDPGRDRGRDPQRRRASTAVVGRARGRRAHVLGRPDS